MKPSNLVVDVAGYARLVDFGFARRLAPGERSVSLLGTPEYLAPEIFLNEGHAAPVDLYALGATLHELLTDTHPFTGDDPQQVYAAALRGERETREAQALYLRSVLVNAFETCMGFESIFPVLSFALKFTPEEVSRIVAERKRRSKEGGFVAVDAVG